MAESPTIEIAQPRATARRKSKAGTNKAVLIGVVVFLAIAFLVYSTMQGNSVYYLSVSELMDRGETAYGEQVRVGAKVQTGSIKSDTKNMKLEFTAYDDKNPGNTLNVVYKGIVPDTFKDEADAVFEGKLSPDGTFQAGTLLAKCPSKYEAADPNAAKRQ